MEQHGTTQDETQLVSLDHRYHNDRSRSRAVFSELRAYNEENASTRKNNALRSYPRHPSQQFAYFSTSNRYEWPKGMLANVMAWWICNFRTAAKEKEHVSYPSWQRISRKWKISASLSQGTKQHTCNKNVTKASRWDYRLRTCKKRVVSTYGVWRKKICIYGRANTDKERERRYSPMNKLALTTSFIPCSSKSVKRKLD